MKKDAYYFSHDSNAKDDPKISLLIDQLGLEGYGIFWVLIETLRDQPDFKYPMKLLPSLARKYATTHEKVKAVVSLYELFEIENDTFFYSKSLIERMIPLQKIKEQRREAVKNRWEKHKQLSKKNEYESNTVVLDSYNENNTGVIERKVKESKVKEKKEEYIKSPFEKIGFELLNSQSWIEGIAMQNQLNFELCKKYLIKFLKEQRSKENTELEMNDYKSHFVSWVKVEIKRDPISEEIKAPSAQELLKLYNRK